MCVDRPVEVVRVGCEDISLDKCITVPDIVTEVETSEVRGRIYSRQLTIALFCVAGVQDRAGGPRLQDGGAGAAQGELHRDCVRIRPRL